jgi:hypothetical protein
MTIINKIITFYFSSNKIGLFTFVIVPFLPNQYIFLLENITILLENEALTCIG